MKKNYHCCFRVLVLWSFLLGTNNLRMEQGFRWDQKAAPALLPGQEDWEFPERACRKLPVSFLPKWKEAVLCLESIWSTYPIVGRKVLIEGAEPHLSVPQELWQCKCPLYLFKEGSEKNGLGREVCFGSSQWSMGSSGSAQAHPLFSKRAKGRLKGGKLFFSTSKEAKVLVESPSCVV